MTARGGSRSSSTSRRAARAAGEAELEPRARELQKIIEQERAGTNDVARRFTLVFNLPQAVAPRLLREPAEMFLSFVREKGFARDVRFIQGGGFFGFDGASASSDADLLGFVGAFTSAERE